MSPDPPRVARPRDPGAGDREPTTASFRGGVEQVDETTAERARVRATAQKARSAPPRGRVRARKVHRIVRHIEPWSVLKISLLFFLALFMIICVASAVLWSAARSAGVIDNVEDFITDVGGFGNCPTPIAVETPTVDPAVSTTTSTLPEDAVDEQDCPDGQALEGTFQFEDGKILEAFALGGIVLVLAGSAGAVVVALLFNLMSDLTGGVRVTVLEEEPPARTGSPTPRDRG